MFIRNFSWISLSCVTYRTSTDQAVIDWVLLKFEIDYLLIKLASNQQNRKKMIKKNAHLAFVFTHSVLHRMLIGHAHFSQFMGWQNLGITTLKHANVPEIFFKTCW